MVAATHAPHGERSRRPGGGTRAGANRHTVLVGQRQPLRCSTRHWEVSHCVMVSTLASQLLDSGQDPHFIRLYMIL